MQTKFYIKSAYIALYTKSRLIELRSKSEKKCVGCTVLEVCVFIDAGELRILSTPGKIIHVRFLCGQVYLNHKTYISTRIFG